MQQDDYLLACQGQAGATVSTIVSVPTTGDDRKLRPALRQFASFKAQYPNFMMLFRMGDYFEMFYDDAKTAASVLAITLTSRDDVPMAGFPAANGDAYMARLIRAGHRIALCEEYAERK